MKIDFRGSDFIVFLNDIEASNVDFLNKRELESYFKSLFLKIKNLYDIDVFGSYDITVYIDDGVVLDIKKDDVDYSLYYDDTIDMKITISKYDKFLYKLDGCIDSIIDKCTVYLYKGDFYVRGNGLNFIEKGILNENSNVIFGNEAYVIIQNGKNINFY